MDKSKIMRFVNLLIGLIAGYFAGAYRKEIKTFFSKYFSHNNYSNINEEHPVSDVIVSAKPNINYDIGKAKSQFLQNQTKFYGIYENLYNQVYNKSKNEAIDLLDWDSRISLLDNSVDLQALWNDMKLSPESFLAFIEQCGVSRDEQSQIVASESTRYEYIEFDGKDIIVNETYKVIKPCWRNGDLLLEKGVIKQ